MSKLIILVFLLLLSACKTNKTKFAEGIQQKDCSFYNDKFIEFSMVNQKDSALFYIDKCISCDPEDLFFKTEKVKHHIKFNEISDAISFIEVSKIDKNSEYMMLKGVLLLRIESPNATRTLEESYKQIKELTETYTADNSNLHFYKIGLDNYFYGMDYSIKIIEKFSNNYNDQQNTALADYLEDLVVQETKERVLYTMFNIN